MALPQRRDPYEEQRELREVERRRAAGAGSGWFVGWWWIWLLVFIGIFWFAGWGWGGYGGWWWGPGAARPGYINANATVNVPTGNGVAILDATDKQPYVGKAFTANNVPVQNMVNDHVFWITANNSAPMLVVLGGAGNNAANAKIGQGDHVDVTGAVEKAPPAAEANKNWNLGNDGAQRLEQEGAYVQATQALKVR